MSTTQIGSVYIETQGEGQAVVCIHGLGGSSNTWTPVLSAFDGFKVIRPDLPGSARSSLADVPLSIDLYVTAIADVIRESNAAPAHIVAHSMGTIVAQHLAVQHPELVKSLVLFGPLLAPPDQGRPATRARATLSREQGVPGLQEIANAIVTGATSAETKALRTVALALIRENIMRQSPEGYAQSCEALADAQAAPIERIQVPTLLITGDEDGVGRPEAVKEMADRIAGSRVTVLEACGHWTTYEKPSQCVTELKHFYESI
ncbi:MAG TPA: alpha/beta fold hydrolase [Eoetvoesiella sp.]